MVINNAAVLPSVRRPSDRLFAAVQRPTYIIIALAALLVAAIVGDSAAKGAFYSQSSSEPAKYQVAGLLAPPVFEAPDFILSKSDRLALPALDLMEDISMTEDDFKAEQAMITARNTPKSSGGSRATISYGAISYSGSGQSNLSAWKAINPDTTAFLRIPGTTINYPVMRGTSYEFKQQDGSYGKSPGALWVHTGPLSSGRAGMQSNTVITGHNWGNCTGAYPFIGPVTSSGRFDQLLSYTSPSFASANPYIYLSIPGEDLTLAVIAAFYVPNIYNDYDNIYNGDAATLAYRAQSRSLFSSGFGVSSSDKLVTFFTCSRYLNTGALQRFVVVTKVL